jgi:hypothetical protein
VLLSIYPKEIKIYVHTKNLGMDVYSSCIHNCSNLEATKMPFENEWVNCGTTTQWNIIQCLEKMSYQVMKRYVGNLVHTAE